MTKRPPTIDPMEQLIRDGLNAGAFRYVDERHPAAKALDFYLIDLDIHIEVKRMHTSRVSDQMARADNVIVAQGDRAVKMLARLLATARYSGDTRK
jgi:hypothetical protein